MGNFISATFQKKIKPAQINELVNKINKERFDNYFSIRYVEGSKASTWDFIEPNDWCYIGFGLEMRHRSSRLNYKYTTSRIRQWVLEYFVEMIAAEFNGVMSDEGIEEKWKPEFYLKYRTPKEYIFAMHQFGQKTDKVFGYIDWRLQRKQIPKQLLDLCMNNNLNFKL